MDKSSPHLNHGKVWAAALLYVLNVPRHTPGSVLTRAEISKDVCWDAPHAPFITLAQFPSKRANLVFRKLLPLLVKPFLQAQSAVDSIRTRRELCPSSTPTKIIIRSMSQMMR